MMYDVPVVGAEEIIRRFSDSVVVNCSMQQQVMYERTIFSRISVW